MLPPFRGDASSTTLVIITDSYLKLSFFFFFLLKGIFFAFVAFFNEPRGFFFSIYCN